MGGCPANRAADEPASVEGPISCLSFHCCPALFMQWNAAAEIGFAMSAEASPSSALVGAPRQWPIEGRQ